MSLDNYKITAYEDNVADLPDYPSDEGFTAKQLKAIFDGRGDKEIKEKHNALVDAVSEIADGGKEHEENTQNPHGVTAEQAGAEPSGSIATHDENGTAHADIRESIRLHKEETGNPHGVTAEQAGAEPSGSIVAHDGSVTAHADIRESIRLHKEDTENPHGVTAAQIGLGNADNTADKDKPVSTATAAALEALREEATEYTDRVASGKADAVKFRTERAKTHVVYDSTDSPIDSLSIYGENNEDEIGENLLNPEDFHKGSGSSGVSYASNGDGTITLSGGINEGETLVIGFTETDMTDVNNPIMGAEAEAGTYIFDVEGLPDNTGLDIALFSKGKTIPETIQITAAELPFTIKKAEAGFINLSVNHFYDGTSDKYVDFGTGTTVKPTLRFAGVKNPTVRVHGKNLIPVRPGTSISGGVTWNVEENGKITASGTATSYSTRKIAEGFFLGAGTYTISIEGVANNVRFETTTLDSINGKQLPQTFTLSKGGTHYLNLTRAANGEVEVNGYIQIEAGSRATEYEPYKTPQTVTVPYTLGSGDAVTLSDGAVKINISGEGTDITETEAGQALLALHTNYPNTSIVCDAPCSAEYLADTTNAFNNLKTTLTQAIIALGGDYNV